MTATPFDPNLRVLHLPTGETIRILASGHDNGGAALEVDALLPPGLPGPPRHRHRTRTESFTVQEGGCRWWSAATPACSPRGRR